MFCVQVCVGAKKVWRRMEWFPMEVTWRQYPFKPQLEFLSFSGPVGWWKLHDEYLIILKSYSLLHTITRCAICPGSGYGRSTRLLSVFTCVFEKINIKNMLEICWRLAPIYPNLYKRGGKCRICTNHRTTIATYRIYSLGWNQL